MTPQQQADRLRILTEELNALERAGVVALDPAQREAIQKHAAARLKDLAGQFDVDTTQAERQLSMGMKIAAALGGLALVIATVLFLNRHLGRLPVWMQVATLVSAPIALACAASWIARDERRRYFSTLVAVVAVAAFVANLAAIGGLFNLAASPHAWLAWGLFSLALGHHLGVRVLVAAGLTGFLLWTSVLLSGDFGRIDHLEIMMAAGAVIALIPGRWPGLVPGTMAPVFRVAGVSGFLLAVLILSQEGRMSVLPMGRRAAEQIYQVVGLLVSTAVLWWGVKRNWASVFVPGIIAFVAFLLLRMADWLWNLVPKYLFFLLVGLTAAGLIALFQRIRRRV